MATLDDWLALDLRVGTVVAAEPLRGARKPCLVLRVEVAEGETRTAIAPLNDMYEPPELVGLQVVVAVNLPPQRVGGALAEVHLLAVGDGRGGSVLLMPERPVPDGGKVG